MSLSRTSNCGSICRGWVRSGRVVAVRYGQSVSRSAAATVTQAAPTAASSTVCDEAVAESSLAPSSFAPSPFAG